MYDFNAHIKETLVNEYGGSGKKKTVILDDGNKYLLKFPNPVRKENGSLSYTNNALSEYIASKIIKALGLPVQEVILGMYTDDKGISNIVCACKDLRSPGEILHTVQMILLSCTDGDISKEDSLRNIRRLAESFKEIPAEEIMFFFYNMFVADAFLGNPNRNNDKWAMITNTNGDVRISPIFGCSSSLFPLLSDEQLDIADLPRESNRIVFAVADDDGRRICYSDYILACENYGVNAAVKRIVHRINMNEIRSIIDDIPCITEKRKNFYKKFLELQYQKILLPAYKKICARDNIDMMKDL